MLLYTSVIKTGEDIENKLKIGMHSMLYKMFDYCVSYI